MIDKNDLISWLKNVDIKLDRKITLIAVGGTAMTLLGLKASTRDIDFCIDSKNLAAFKRAIDNEFKVDIFVDGFIFAEQLPDDYADLAIDILQMEKIYLKALSPIDIVITKTARLNARDEEDIAALPKKIDRESLIKRFEGVIETYAGNESIYRYNFDYVLNRYFKT